MKKPNHVGQVAVEHEQSVCEALAKLEEHESWLRQQLEANRLNQSELRRQLFTVQRRQATCQPPQHITLCACGL